ncbi:MAG TPA: DUF2125 domain-containing protein [Caulobacteraceae bacterium]|nr:DUF2125 domain-containing protein [Caulobacteraceae bacterium]
MPTQPAVEPSNRRGRLGLLLPILLVLLALGGWTVWWFVVANRVAEETDRAAADLRRAGYQVAWTDRDVTGWPYRTLVRFQGFKVAAPSGHALAAPRLDVEANTYALDKWVAVAPDGLVLTRGAKGEVRVAGGPIRASLSGLRRSPPNLVVELRKPVFTPAAGAEPFPLASAELVDLYLRPRAGGAVGEGEFLVRVDGGKPRPDGMLDWIGAGEPFSMHWEGRVAALNQFRGASWREAARRWASAGGALSQVRGVARAGNASLDAASQRLWVGLDGRLRGGVAMTLKGGPESLMALGRSQAVDQRGATAAAAATAVAGGLDGTARVRLDFTDEGAKIGPFRLSGSPTIF